MTIPESKTVTPQTSPASQTASAASASDPASTTPQRQLYSHAITQSPEFLSFQVDFAVCLKELKEYFDMIIAGNYQTPDQLLSHVDALIRPGRTTKDSFEMLHSLRAVDDSVYAHSLNVAMIARMIGKWLKFPAETLRP